MVIERVTGGKPPEVRQAERSSTDAKRAEAGKEGRAGKAGSSEASVTTNVSAKSQAAIKAYRIATETKPDIARAQKVAEIKAQVERGEYNPSSENVAEAILKNVIKES